MSPQLTLDVGPRVVKRLIPQRPPLLLVDRVLWFEPGPQPRGRCARTLSAEEPVFAGHFPGYPLWPGVYTIEGLGQGANLVAALDCLFLAADDPARVVEALRALDAGAEDFELPELGPPRMGMSAAVDVKLLEPIFAGATVEYEVQRTHVLGDAARFAVEAWVDGRPVARGSITGSTRIQPPGAR